MKPIDARMLVDLRDKTGAGMHDAAVMLRRAGGDMLLAEEGLRCKGQAVVRAKRWFDDCRHKKPGDPKCFDSLCADCAKRKP